MKKLALLFTLVFSLSYGQDKKISQLTSLPSVLGAEMIPVARSGANYYMTPSQLNTYFSSYFAPLSYTSSVLYSTSPLSISSNTISLGTVPVNKGGTNITTYTTGDLLYASGSSALSRLGIGSTGQVLGISGGVPTWTTVSSGGTATLTTNYLGFGDGSNNLAGNSNYQIHNGTNQVQAIISSGISGSSYNLNPTSGDPPHIFEVVNDGSTQFTLRFSTYGTAGGQNDVHWNRYRGTSSSPSAIQKQDYFWSFGGRGYNGVTTTQSASAFQSRASENWSTTNNGAEILLQTNTNGTNANSRHNTLTLRHNGAGYFSSKDTASPYVTTTNLFVDLANADASITDGMLINHGASAYANVILGRTTGDQATIYHYGSSVGGNFVGVVPYSSLFNVVSTGYAAMSGSSTALFTTGGAGLTTSSNGVLISGNSNIGAGSNGLLEIKGGTAAIPNLILNSQTDYTNTVDGSIFYGSTSHRIKAYLNGTLQTLAFTSELPGTVVNQITASDNSIGISANTGTVNISLATSHANTWTGIQTWKTNGGIYPIFLADNGDYAVAEFNQYGTSAQFAGLQACKAGGTIASPTATANNSQLFNITAYGYKGSGVVNGSGVVGGAALFAKATEAYGSTNGGSQWKFQTNANGTNSIRDVLTLDQDGSVIANYKAFFGGTTTPTAFIHAAASTTSNASLRLTTGVAPSSPNTGDMYQDGTHCYMWLAGAWKQLDN